VKEREEGKEEGERRGETWEENMERRGGKENKTRGTEVSDIKFTHV
jgi:hypothetical protein